MSRRRRPPRPRPRRPTPRPRPLKAKSPRRLRPSSSRSTTPVRNELRQDPATPLRRLRSVSISIDLAAQENFLTHATEAKGCVKIGDTRIADLTVQSVTLDNSDPKAGRVPTVMVDVCYDVTDVDIVDADGKSALSRTTAPTRGWVRHSVSNYEWETDRSGAWRVATSENLEQPPCDAP